ncbi:hypothetical protein, partial [Pelomonas sp. KK5]|uniref:beta strand repeat-containing protein n=1 Tax=Pelomonas sp. KK5 TaxID=1855730 RepID=UPI001301D230
MGKRRNWWNQVRNGLNGKKQGAGKPPSIESAADPSSTGREKLVFEHLEPRLLLSDTPLPLPVFAASGTLAISAAHSNDIKVETIFSGGQAQIRVWDNTLNTSLGQVALNQNVKVSISGLPLISDAVQVDLGYDDGNAAGTTPVNPFALMIELDGGTDAPLLSDDTMTVLSSGPDFYTPTGLFLKSTDDIVFAGNLNLGSGTLNVDSQEAITASGVSLTASDMFLGVTKAVTDGVTLIDGLNLLGNASGAITLTNTNLTANDIGLIVNSSVNVNTTDSSYASNFLKIAFIQTQSNAAITVDGTSQLNATAGKLTLASTSTVTAKATTQPDANSTQSDKDASVASAVVSSGASVSVGGTAALKASGNLILKSTNTLDVQTLADGTAGSSAGAAGGGTVAVSQLGGDTTVDVNGSATLQGSSIAATATTTRTVHTTAKATAGGATQPSGTPTQGQTQLANNNAATGDGSLNFAAAVAVTHVGGDTTARLRGGSVTSGGALTVTASSATSSPAGALASTEADGTAATGSPGVGVAAALNFAGTTTSATLGGTAAINTASATFAASTTTDALFGARAVSGAGSTSGLAVAGSLALNVSVMDTDASIEAGSNASATTGLTFNATSNTHNMARALPKVDGATGKSTGVGASVAINVVDETTSAQVMGKFSGTSLAQNASATGDVQSEAQGGASGGTAVAPVVAVTVSNTASKVGLTGSGDLTLSAGLTSDAKNAQNVLAKGSGDAKGDDSAAVGASVVVTYAAPIVELALDGKLQAGAAVLLTGKNTGTTRSEIKAAARGASDKGQNSTQQGDSAKGAGNAAAANNGAKGSAGATPQANTGDGPVTVAAAIGVQVLNGQSQAHIGDGANIKTTAGAVSLKNESDLDSQVDASGAASKGSTNIGAAVAINVAQVYSDAHVGAASVDSQGLALGAGTVSGARSESTTTATSGAAGGNTGVAGSLAIGVGISNFSATLASGANVNAHAGAVSLDANSTTGDAVKAQPDKDGVTAENTGVGASVAINVADHTSRAEMKDGSTLGASGATSLSSKTDSAITTTATGGAKGGTAVTPVVAITVANQDSIARIGSGSTAVNASGAVSVGSTLASTNTTSAEGKAEGTKDAAVGAAVAVNVENDTSQASTARSVTSTGAIGVSATSTAASTASSKASAVGGKEDDSNSSSDDKAVDDQNNAARGSGDSAAGAAGARNSSTSKATPSAQGTGGGTVSVAAAVSVNVAQATSRATVGGGTLTAGGALSLDSKTDSDAKATADGSTRAKDASNPNDTGVGAAVAINVGINTNEARVLGDAIVASQGVNVRAGMSGNGTQNTSAEAKSGAGGAKTSIAGALAINVAVDRTTAEVVTGASINAGSGASTISAATKHADNASAVPTDTGVQADGKDTGVGASVAVNVADHVARAEVDNGAAISSSGALSVTGTLENAITTSAQGGAKGGTAVAPVVAVTVANQDAIGRIGTSAALLTTSGNLAVGSSLKSTNTTKAEGKAEGSKDAAVGAAVAVNVELDHSTASLNRSVNTTGSVGVTAASQTASTGSAKASAIGGKEDDSNSSSDDHAVDDQNSAARSSGDAAAAAGGARNSSSSKATPSAEGGSGGTVSVAAAVAVNIAASTAAASA